MFQEMKIDFPLGRRHSMSPISSLVTIVAENAPIRYAVVQFSSLNAALSKGEDWEILKVE